MNEKMRRMDHEEAAKKTEWDVREADGSTAIATAGLTRALAGRMHLNMREPEIQKRVADQEDERLVSRYVNNNTGEDFYDYDPVNAEAWYNYIDHDERERTEYSAENRTFEVFPLSKEILERYEFLEKLPKNIAVMGGTARSIAREMLTGDREPVRDIDLVNILDQNGESLNDEETLNELAREYMPDDYAFGHGIEDETLEKYFETRDLTANEALVMNGVLIVSNFAYNDLQENIIRPTYYELRDFGTRPSGRLAMRALMMQTVLSECTSSYPVIEDMMIAGNYLGSFNIALNLNKAMSRGARTAVRFTDILADYEAIPVELAGKPKATARYLKKYQVERFEFRPNNDKRIKNDGQGDEPMNRPGRGKIDYHAADPEVRKAIEEYEDDLDTERYEGHYTQEEFDEINQQKYVGYDFEDSDYDYEDDWDEWEEEEDE